MSTLVLVLVFVALGVGVLLLALSGGRKREKKQSSARVRTQRRLSIAAFALALVGLGVGVPAAVIGAVSNRDSVPEENISNLTASEKRGRELFGEHCKNCHALAAGNASAQVGPNLDQLAPPKALVLDAIENGRARGNGNMAPDLVGNEDARDVANFIAKAVGKATPQEGGG